MRILLVSANFRPHVGGIERFTEILAEGLAARGHEVTVLCCRYGRAPLHEAATGLSVVRVPASYTLDRRLNVPYPLPSPAPLVRALRGLVARAEVVHPQDALYASSVAALALARRRRVPAVLTQHVGFVPQAVGWLDAFERLAIGTLGRSARLASVVTSYNPVVADWAREQWKLRDVRVLPVAVRHAEPAADRAGLRGFFGLPADRFLALFVGRDVPKKGLDVFLEASDPAYELVAVTDREEVSGRGILLPFMPPERLLELLTCVDAFVLPSAEGEGFPLSLQEALASGLPVVTTPHPGYEHYLSHGDALVVAREPGAVRAALRQLARGEELRRRLSERARAVADRHFDVERFVSAYEELYAEVVGRSGSPGA